MEDDTNFESNDGYIQAQQHPLIIDSTDDGNCSVKNRNTNKVYTPANVYATSLSNDSGVHPIQNQGYEFNLQNRQPYSQRQYIQEEMQHNQTNHYRNNYNELPYHQNRKPTRPNQYLQGQTGNNNNNKQIHSNDNFVNNRRPSSFSPNIKFILLIIVCLLNMFVLWYTYSSLNYNSYEVNLNKNKIIQLETLIENYKESERVKKIKPTVIINGVHSDINEDDSENIKSLIKNSANSHHGVGIPIGAGRGYHNHTYETIHYEFILDTKTKVWEKYPNKGSIPYISVDRLLFFYLCCRAEMGEFICSDTRNLEAKITRDYETQDQYLKVRISDMALAGKSCTLTFTLDVHPEE